MPDKPIEDWASLRIDRLEMEKENHVKKKERAEKKIAQLEENIQSLREVSSSFTPEQQQVIAEFIHSMIDNMRRRPGDE